MIRIALIAAAVTALAACSPHGGAPPAAAGGDSDDAAAVRAVEAQWNKDFKAGDVEPIVSHYSHDARLIAPLTRWGMLLLLVATLVLVMSMVFPRLEQEEGG